MSVNFRLRDARSALQKIEVAAFVGLADVLREDGAVAALEFAGRGLPGAFSLLQFCLGNLQVQNPLVDIELDEVAVSDQRERPANVGFRRDVQYAGAVARSAHARIR